MTTAIYVVLLFALLFPYFRALGEFASWAATARRRSKRAREQWGRPGIARRRTAAEIG